MMKFKIVTPERVMLDIEVESLTIPTKTGQITILENHVPLVTELRPGEIKYRSGGKEEYFVVSGGFAEVRNGKQVVLLADSAEFGHEIDIERAEQARQRAKQMMSESFKDEAALAEAAATFERSLARLRLARKHRTRTHHNLESGTFNE